MSSHGTNAPNLDEEEMFPEISSFFSIICSSVVKSKLNNIRPEVLRKQTSNILGEKTKKKLQKRKKKNFNYKLTNNKTWHITPVYVVFPRIPLNKHEKIKFHENVLCSAVVVFGAWSIRL